MNLHEIFVRFQLMKLVNEIYYLMTKIFYNFCSILVYATCTWSVGDNILIYKRKWTSTDKKATMI